MKGKVLVVDDEKPIAEILKYNLEEEGFQVLVAYDGDEALRLAFQEHPDIILLDIMLPRMDGFNVCKRIRQELDIPIIMLTARETELDKVLGLELGADDYVTKPFSVREVIARINATLRRVKMQQKPPEYLSCGNLTMDLCKMEFTKGEKQVELTYREFTFLAYLLKNAGYVFSREKLLEEVWGYDYIGDERTVDVTVRRIREKIEDDPGNPTYLCTRRGAGYYLRRPS
ncbi:MAG: response regulator [Bacillota bacterium]|nr:response regulator [Bacillota bacterium]